MEKCIICGKTSEEMCEITAHGKNYRNVCPVCKNKISSNKSPQFPIWVKRMIEIDKMTDEGFDLLEAVTHSSTAIKTSVFKNAKWSRLFSLIMTFVGLITVAIGATIGYLISDILGNESICIIAGAIVGGIIAIFEIAFGKVIAEIGENIATIRTIFDK